MEGDSDDTRTLGSALRRELPRLDQRLHAVVQPYGSEGPASVGLGERWVRIFLFEPGTFHIEFWALGVAYAHGTADTFDEMVRVVASWLLGLSLRELAARFPFFEPHRDADAFERGEEVERRWQRLLTEPFPLRRVNDRLAPVLVVAAATPRLRELFPFTSLWSLCFSRCTGYPYSRDIPHITPVAVGDRDGYEVRTPQGVVLGRGEAETAVALVVANLPANCGPAVPGTADMLDESGH